MTKAETKKLLQIMAALYPNWHPEDLDLAVDAWRAVLQDETAQDMADALREFAKEDKKGFPPSPGMLIDLAEKARERRKWEAMAAAITAKQIERMRLKAEERKLIGG